MRGKIQKANTINVQYVYLTVGTLLDTRFYDKEIPINGATAQSLYRDAEATFPDGECPEHAWITVTLHAHERLRTNPGPPGTPLASLSRDVIQNEIVQSAGQSFFPWTRRFSRAKARIKWNDDSGTAHQVDLDVGHGQSLTFFGGGAQVFILGPDSMEETPQAGGFQGASGGNINDLIADAAIECSISAQPAAPSVPNKAYHTQIVPTDNTVVLAPQRVEIPPGAKRAMGYFTTATVPTLTWDTEDPGMAFSIGLIPAFAFTINGAGVPVPGPASAILVGTIAAAGSLATIVHEVSP